MTGYSSPGRRIENNTQGYRIRRGHSPEVREEASFREECPAPLSNTGHLADCSGQKKKGIVRPNPPHVGDNSSKEQ
ncbi:hypothetical protein BOX24_06050 [Leptospirillum ferriphilum]|uniref:Uncharacterized protein n=1 Tax=Leptospirillum ferriphilum TaxID=178606 RepID=A0A1V3SVT9_9BACT|nr:hypothetical protein BOX24_06050 [Leptospirillum ferriphilum]